MFPVDSGHVPLLERIEKTQAPEFPSSLQHLRLPVASSRRAALRRPSGVDHDLPGVRAPHRARELGVQRLAQWGRGETNPGPLEGTTTDG